MRISNSKKQLAKIIHENGGWRARAQFSAQDKGGEVVHYAAKPTIGAGRGVWSHKGCIGGGEFTAEKLPNWHQTILSRAEYFHLYPAPAEVVVENKTTRHLTVTDKPTIEHLAADYRNLKDYAARKQQEANAAKADADAKLAALVAAGEALGLVLSAATTEPKLVITDVKDLLAGDEVRCVNPNGGLVEPDSLGVVVGASGDRFFTDFPEQRRYVYLSSHLKRGDVVFVRRPAKGGANA